MAEEFSKTGHGAREIAFGREPGERKQISESCPRDGITRFQSGFCWLVGYIVLSIVIARITFWSRSWNFSWMPGGLPKILAFYFVVVHLGIGPLCILFCDVIGEMGKIRQHSSWRPPRLFLRDFAKRFYTARYLLNGALAYGLVCGALIGYTNLKAAIPLLDRTLYDDLLFRWDGYLMHVLSFGGLVTIPTYSTVTVFFDTTYFQMWTLSCVTLVMTFRDTAGFWRFTAAWCLTFGLSMPISIFFPSLGPAFYKPELFAHMGNTHSAAVMRNLWENYLSFKMNPHNTSIVGGSGIVAMPSLHIALVYLSVIKLGKYFPRLRFILWGFLVLFMTATVYLGWHYLSDGIVGVLLGWLAYRISAWWFDEKFGGGSAGDDPQRNRKRLQEV
jgi:hypothetical protein